MILVVLVLNKQCVYYPNSISDEVVGDGGELHADLITVMKYSVAMAARLPEGGMFECTLLLQFKGL